MDAAEKESADLEVAFQTVVQESQLGVLTDVQAHAAKAVLFISRLHQLEAGVAQLAGLLHYLGVMRAHVDGAYRSGKMCHWEQGWCIPADLHIVVTKALKAAATYLFGCKSSAAVPAGMQESVSD